ncbi:unnamed protein product, partial [Heterosigma akashiwo]
AHVCADPRLAPLVRNLSVQYTGQDYGAQAGAAPGLVTPDKLDMLANRSMPLCMSQMHRAVQRDHHLKHTGRIQLGLFLKGAGLSLEDALVWWQRAFTKGMSVDQFNKKGYPTRSVQPRQGGEAHQLHPVQLHQAHRRRPATGRPDPRVPFQNLRRDPAVSAAGAAARGWGGQGRHHGPEKGRALPARLPTALRGVAPAQGDGRLCEHGWRGQPPQRLVRGLPHL